MFGVVILNYVNFKETVETLQSLSSHCWFSEVRIFVVENGSNNNSLATLRRLQKDIAFELIVSEVNLGFGRGANLGIAAARAQGCQFIIELNSDAQINADQPFFLERIVEIFSSDRSIALITVDIKNPEGVPQNPMRRDEFSFFYKLFFKSFFLFHLDKIYFWFRTEWFFYSISRYVAQREKKFKLINANTTPPSGFIYAALGSCQVLTPAFFEHFEGHDPVTFLYCEEYVLAEHLKNNGLKTWYENSLHVVHKESKSVEAITKDKRDKIKFLLKHMFISGRIYAKMLKLWRY